MRSRLLVSTLFGTVAGFAGFVLQEFLVSHDPVLLTSAAEVLKVGAYVGMMLGIGIGSVEGVVLGSGRTLLRGAGLGALVGAVGGLFGIYVGGTVYTIALFGKHPYLLLTGGGMLDFAHVVLARALGWTCLGAFPGLAAGVATRSHRRALHGLVGGLLGGFAGGFAFDLVATLFAAPLQGMAAAATGGPRIIEIGGPSRAVGFAAIGFFTGLFIGLVEELMKQAWVRVLVGRNEGRDYILSRELTILGRDERADIPLFADPNLAPQHAAIRAQGRQFVLLDGGTPIGTFLNGQRVTEAVLKDGDTIQLGQVRLLFREKATATRPAPVNRDAALSRQGPPPVQTPPGACPFCGAMKDAAGNCRCTVPVVPTAPQAPPVMLPTTAVPFSAAMPGDATIGSRLVALDGPYAGQVFPLQTPLTTIGREVGRDVTLSMDQAVSRRHARIELQNGIHVLRDEGSANGTFVNGVRVTEQPLAVGDVVRMGSGSYRYE